MPFVFSPQLIAQLTRILAAQQRTTAIMVSCFMDECVYLTLDGRIVVEGADDPPQETNDPWQIHATLLTAANRFDLPELRRFLPPRPPTGLPCPTWQGTHYMAGGAFVCTTCAGRGWVDGPA